MLPFIYTAIMGVFSSAIAYVSWSIAFAKANKASQVSNYMFVTPFLASVLGFLIASEVPNRQTLIGGTIILIGLLIFNFGKTLYNKKELGHKKV
jgi:drug/metabolite transporter (DMT)-like permease